MTSARVRRGHDGDLFDRLLDCMVNGADGDAEERLDSASTPPGQMPERACAMPDAMRRPQGL